MANILSTVDEEHYEAVVIGAGLAGIYMLIRLRMLGMRARALEAGGGVGGTWYWNRYPGARCDVESRDYSYSFSEDLEREWVWSERYASQPEILRYLNYVVDRFELRDGIDLNTNVVGTVFDEDRGAWRIQTADGRTLVARYCIAATGPLSVPQKPQFEGLEAFSGDVYHTGDWPHEEVSFEGKRVGVFGTGSSGIQIIPELAREAGELTVFQRTPNFSIPSRNREVTEEEAARRRQEFAERRRASRLTRLGWPLPDETSKFQSMSALESPPDERRRAYDLAWAYGGPSFVRTYKDLVVDERANDTAASYVREKIRSIVKDPSTASSLEPNDHPIGTKRICVDQEYYGTFNKDSVRLVNLREDPVVAVDGEGVRTQSAHYKLDAIVFATGFDALTGALMRLDVQGRGGVRLQEAWAEGPRTYLGLMAHGFPNFFMVAGPGSPSVFVQMFLAAEQHVDWIAGCLSFMREQGVEQIEPLRDAEGEWVAHVNELAAQTLLMRANSWYLGANIPGKPRVFMPYVGGYARYSEICDDVARRGYEGFRLRPRPSRRRSSPGQK